MQKLTWHIVNTLSVLALLADLGGHSGICLFICPLSSMNMFSYNVYLACEYQLLSMNTFSYNVYLACECQLLSMNIFSYNVYFACECQQLFNYFMFTAMLIR